MIVEAQVTINGSKTAVWDVITDIENADQRLSGIEKIEIVEKPAAGIVGLTWRETRIYFGKPATVEIRITDAAENEFYKTRAESDGFLFLSTLSILGNGDGVTLATSHDYLPQGFAAKVKSVPMFLFKGMIKKALMQDLTDIKSAVEQKQGTSVISS
ncbi:MAG TPA: SRPBCC family protein [Pyrinomonadaceae bacterium]|nr:SRPBCC family protein [Pyrinomonadaceae bacterium]